MLPDDRDAAHLWAMVKWGEYLVRKSAAISLDELVRDEDQQLMVAKAAELIGEAARKGFRDVSVGASRDCLARHHGYAQHSRP